MARQPMVDNLQPACHSLGADVGESPNPLGNAQDEPDLWYDWMVTSERLADSHNHVTVRDLLVLEGIQCGARISFQETTASK